jgi:hypothetical protein
MRLGILALILSALISYFLPDVNFESQQKLHASLLQISSIVLAITGAWAAIVYPDALGQILKKHESDKKMNEINDLIKPMTMALFILGVLIAIQLISFIIDISKPSINFLLLSQKINLAILIYLYLLQVYSIILTFLPISDARGKATFENKKNKMLDEINK